MKILGRIKKFNFGKLRMGLEKIWIIFLLGKLNKLRKGGVEGRKDWGKAYGRKGSWGKCKINGEADYVQKYEMFECNIDFWFNRFYIGFLVLI